jgi:hypothetical protein
MRGQGWGAKRLGREPDDRRLVPSMSWFQSQTPDICCTRSLGPTSARASELIDGLKRVKNGEIDLRSLFNGQPADGSAGGNRVAAVTDERHCFFVIGHATAAAIRSLGGRPSARCAQAWF